MDGSRTRLDRKKRAQKRSRKDTCQDYVKRKMTNETVCHYVLYPIIPSTIEKSNDFYFRALRLIWNERNISKDPQCQKLIKGLRTEDIETLNIENLSRDEENGWFSSSRKNDLVKIGEIAGYILRNFACSVGQSLDEKSCNGPCKKIKRLDDLFEELKSKGIIRPVIIKLEISPNSNFDSTRFICLEENVVNILVNGKELVLSRRVKLLHVHNTFHHHTWSILNTCVKETRLQLIKDIENDDLEKANSEDATIDGVPIDILRPIVELVVPEERETCNRVVLRPASTRSKKKSSKYPSDQFVIV